MYSHTVVLQYLLISCCVAPGLFTSSGAADCYASRSVNVLFWFLGLSLDAEVWDHPSFSTNQQRFIDTDGDRKFLAKIVKQVE
jgi:hypothetical protein